MLKPIASPMPISLRMIRKPSSEYTGTSGRWSMVGEMITAISAARPTLTRLGMVDSPNSGAVPIRASRRNKGQRKAAIQA